MAEQKTLEKIRERRLDKMRRGKEAAELVEIPSMNADPEVGEDNIRVALVPLTESEYDRCIQSAAMIPVPDNVAGAQVQDRHEKREVIRFAMREVDNLEKHVFNSVDEMMEVLETDDVNHVYDCYAEMIETNSPAVVQLSEEEIEYLKKVFENLLSNVLSGKQLYAINRLLLITSPTQLVGS
jgi:hypothetical protein